jgi:hypothetical protein
MPTYHFFSYLIKFIKNNNPIKILKIWQYKRIFLRTPPRKVIILSDESELDIYVIAFNKPKLIEAQIKFLKENLKDKYRLIVVDNSNRCTDEIEEICKNNKVSYIKLPANKLEHSHSH